MNIKITIPHTHMTTTFNTLRIIYIVGDLYCSFSSILGSNSEEVSGNSNLWKDLPERMCLVNLSNPTAYFTYRQISSSSSCSGRVRFDSCSLYPQNETGPSISSSVVLCVFVLLVYVVVLA